MPRFGLITEGITDQIVIENLLYGFFNSYDVEITELQPLKDATDENLATTNANWHKVFEYCKSSFFKGAMSQDDFYAIIHIDSDVFLGDSVSKEYSVETRNEEGELSTEILLENIVNKFIETIGEAYYEFIQEKIIFAIAIHSTECWLLPLYFSNSKKGKVANCLKTLNEELSKKYKFTIDSKKPAYYRKASKDWRKHKILMKKFHHNFSLKVFINNLSDKNIELETEEEDW